MRKHRWRQLSVVLLTIVSAAPMADAAQESLSAVILRGISARPGSAPSGIASPLVPGVRVESPARMWTELAFSDGSSIVLEPRADFTLQGFGKDPRTGHLVIRGSTGRGRLRVATSGNVDVVIQTGGTEVEVVAATAVILAGADGSAVLISGKSVEVRRGDRDDMLRRPGYAIAFADGLVQKLSPQQLTEALDSFAPVAMGGVPANAVVVAQASTTKAPATAGSLTYVNPNNSIGLSAPIQSSQVPGPTAQSPGPSPQPPGPSPQPLGPSPQPPGPSPQPPGPSPQPPGPSPQPPGPPQQPRQPLSFSLPAANLTLASSTGSNIAAPGANSGTSSINGEGNIFSLLPSDNINTGGNGGLVGGSQDSLIAGLDGLSQFGTGRVRRFAPESSGALSATAMRNDSGTVTLNNVRQPANSFFQNLSNSMLSTTANSTFYDAIANVGVVSLHILQPIGSTGDIQGSQFYQSGTIPRITISDNSTPVVKYICNSPNCSGGTLNHEYFGGAVLESPLAGNTDANGRVSALQGGDGLIVIHTSASALPGPSTGGPDQFFGRTESGQVGAPNRTLVPAGIYIIDKITHSSEAIAAERQIQDGERYFVIGGTPFPPPPTNVGGLPGVPLGTVMRFAISDGLNPLGGFVTGQTIEQQFIAPGNTSQPAAFNQYNAFRPEETFVPGAARGDTHLLVIADQSGRNPSMRADLQIAGNGASSASVSVGGIGTIPDTKGNPTLALSGATVGSAQLDTTRSALAITSNLGSLGTADDGVGAHMFPGSDKAPGQVGYFAVSQADTRLGAPGTDAGVQPGTIQAVGNPGAASQFAYTRLATNVGPPPNLPPPGTLDSAGFATGVVQSFTNGQGSLYAISTSGPDGVSIKSNASNTEFTAAINMTSTSVGSLASDPQAAPAPAGVPGAHALNFGGNAPGPPTTAVISPATFAAVVPGQAAMASVDGDLLRGVATSTGTNVPASDEHLAWGFFLGDLAEKANNQQQNHVNLGFWVAGRLVPASVMQSLTGTATYSGGLVGTAVDSSGMSTTVRGATGNFAQFWDFGARKGSMNANFDGRAWAGLQSTMPAGANVFTGSGMSGDRLMSVQGAFFHNTATGGPLSASNLPLALGGLFAVHGPHYGANGIMVGRR